MFNEKPIISKWVADIYDQKVTETDDVDFLLSIIGKEPKRILEVCCGSGRILVPLAKAGHTVVGIDADTFMLGKIHAKAEGLTNIKWREADAVHDDWGSGFDVVVLAGNILYNIVSDMDYKTAQELFVKKAASALVPGGYVYIAYNPGGHKITKPVLSQPHENREQWIVWEATDKEGNFGKMILLPGSFDAETSVHSFVRRFELTLVSGEKIQQDISCVKHFATLPQIHEWLSAAGFVIELECEDFDKNPINDDSCNVIIYARKKGNVEYKFINNPILEKMVDTYGEWVKKYVFVRDDAFALAAMDGSLLVGFICVTPRALTYPLADIKDAFIEIYEVHEHYRRQGIGRHLVIRAEDWARKAGFKQIRTHHNNKADAAIKMSFALGYSMCPHNFYKEEGCDGYWVAKNLTLQFIGKITIKQTDESDLPNILELWNCGKAMKYVGYPNGLGWTMEDMRIWYDKQKAWKGGMHYSIYADGIGYCGETFYGGYDVEYEHRNMGLEIKLLPVAQGKGIAAYALRYAIDRAYNSGSFDKVWAEPNPENEPAKKLYTKLGLKPQPRPAYLHPADTYWELDLSNWNSY